MLRSFVVGAVPDTYRWGPKQVTCRTSCHVPRGPNLGPDDEWSTHLSPFKK